MYRSSPENLKRTPSPAEIANLKMGEILSIQIALMKDFIENDSGTAEGWVDKNGASFREIITDKLIDLWKENEEEAKDEIKKLLEDYKIEGN